MPTPEEEAAAAAAQATQQAAADEAAKAAAAAPGTTPPTAAKPPEGAVVPDPAAQAAADAAAKAQADAAAAAAALAAKAAELELKLPADALVKPEYVASLKAYAKEIGLTQDQAQKLLEKENSSLAAFRDSQVKAFNAEQSAWKDEISKDPLFGGTPEQIAANAELARRALQTYADPDFIKMLDETQLGNHPGLNRLLLKIGKASADDVLRGAGTPPVKPKEKAEVLRGMFSSSEPKAS